ncbi:hypothetical protein NMG60_11031242 [Bertholletia excelsa]
MGKRSSVRKAVQMFDNDDTVSVSSLSTTRLSNKMVSGPLEVLNNKESLLDQCIDALYEKRGSTREKALEKIVETFSGNLQHEFVEKKFVTMLHQFIYSIKRGSAKEISLACHAIGLLALTTGPGDKAQEILKESLPHISLALKSGSESSNILSLLKCLAVITFIGWTEPEEAEKSMDIMWQLVHPKMGSNVVATKHSPATIAAMVSAWAFLLTIMDGQKLEHKNWQESISFLSTLLDKDDRSIRIAAGEALALIFEGGNFEKFSPEYAHIQGLRGKILNQVRNLSTEAGGKGSNKKDLQSQRNLFRDILEFLEDGYSPETSMKIGGESLNIATWSQLIQLNFLRHFLGGGLDKHMQENEFLHDVFGFVPNRKQLLGNEHHMSYHDKRLHKSPNSILNKARTQFRNKQRMLSQDRNTGHYAVNLAEEVF